MTPSLLGMRGGSRSEINAIESPMRRLDGARACQCVERMEDEMRIDQSEGQDEAKPDSPRLVRLRGARSVSLTVPRLIGGAEASAESHCSIALPADCQMKV